MNIIPEIQARQGEHADWRHIIHAHPELAWYDLPSRYRAHKERFLAMNGGYAFPSYWSILSAYAFRPKEPPPHPLMPHPDAAE